MQEGTYSIAVLGGSSRGTFVIPLHLILIPWWPKGLHKQLPGLKSNGQQNPEAMSQSTKTKGAKGLQVDDRIEDA